MWCVCKRLKRKCVGCPKKPNPFNAVGNCEMYCAKKSPFWLSPSYEMNVVRVDPSILVVQDLYDNYWNKRLIPGARLHWGKYQPEPGEKCGL